VERLTLEQEIEETAAAEGEVPAFAPPEPQLDWQLILLTVICVILVFAILYVARAVFLPLVLAVMLRMMLYPVVRTLTDVRIPEPLGAALVLAVILGAVGYGFYALAQPAAEWVDRMPLTLSQLGDRLQILRHPVEQVQQAGEALSKLTEPESGTTPVARVIEGSPLGSLIFSQTTEFLIEGGATLVLLYFLLASGDLFLRKLVIVLPRFHDKKRAVEIARQIQSDMSHFVFTVATINLVFGILVGIGLHFLGMPNPALWGVMVSVLNFIPFLGHAVSFAVIALVALLTHDSFGAAILPPLLFLVLAVLEGNVITPAILARRLTLNPVAVFTALIFWGWLWGVPGALLAVPMLAVFKIVCDRLDPLKPIGEFLGY
jgi:predicted PurR-regulated permease PerM